MREDCGYGGDESESRAVVHWGAELRDGRRECGVCGRWISKSYYSRHRRTCDGEQGMEVRRKMKPCEVCGKLITVRNMARHIDTVHRVWDPGGGPRP